MSTTNATDIELRIAQLKKNRRDVAIGLGWGGIMLAILAIWQNASPSSVSFVVTLLWIMAATFVGLCVWQLFARPDSEQELLRQRRLIGRILLAVGGVLLLLAIWLGFWKGIDVFGEAASMAVLALIAMGTAAFQLVSAVRKIEQDQIFEKLASSFQYVQWPLLIVGTLLLCLVTTTVVLNALADVKLLPVGPELVGILLLGWILQGAGLALFSLTGTKPDLVLLIALVFAVSGGLGLLPIGIWMLFPTSPEERFSGQKMRLFVMVVGGLVGMLVTVTSVLRLLVSRNEVLFGGFAAWRGPDAWSLWLGIYAALFGLAIMFCSLLLARTDVRANATARRVLYGFNAVFASFLMLGLLLVANLVIYAQFPMTLQWNSSRGLYALSSESVEILRQLDRPTKVYVLLSIPALLNETRDFLNNCQTVTDKLEVKFISPDKEQEDFLLVEDRYPELKAKSKTSDLAESRGLLVVYGVEPQSPKEEQPPHAFIPFRELVEVGRKRGTDTTVFNGEKVFMRELRFLMEGRKKTNIYFLQGNGELGLRKPKKGDVVDGFSHLPMTAWLGRLKKENFNVYGLSFKEGKDDGFIKHARPSTKGGQKIVPADADLVVIAGPTRRLSRDALVALDRYMDKESGRLLALMEPMPVKSPKGNILKTGLEPLFEKFNVDLTDKYLLKIPRRGDRPWLVVATPPLSDNLVAKQFDDNTFELDIARIVDPIKKGFNYKAETLLHVVPTDKQPLIWPETDLSWRVGGQLLRIRNLVTKQRYLQRKTDNPQSVAVSVIDSRRAPRMIVIGDSLFVCDDALQERSAIYNLDFANSCIDWLIERPGVGISPPEPGVYVLPPNTNLRRLQLEPTWLMILIVIAFGVGVWVVRRC